MFNGLFVQLNVLGSTLSCYALFSNSVVFDSLQPGRWLPALLQCVCCCLGYCNVV